MKEDKHLPFRSLDLRSLDPFLEHCLSLERLPLLRIHEDTRW